MVADDVIAVFDLEFTAWEGSGQRDWSGPGEYKEIVQIGAVKLDDGKELNEIGGFKILVRPSINPRLSDYLINLTGITQADVDAQGVGFCQALDAFGEFLGPETRAVYSFGTDLQVLEINCALNHVAPSFDAGLFHNIRPLVCGVLGSDEMTTNSCDLPELFGFPPPGTKHQARDDARCIAQALRVIRKQGGF